MRNLLVGLALATLGILAGSANAAPERAPDANTHVITISTRGGTVTQRVTLSLGKAVIVQLDADARDVLVSSPDIVDAVVRTPRRIFLLALKVGQTNAFFFDGAGRQLASIDIRVEKDVVDLSAMIARNMPGSNIKVSALNDNVVLSGTVSSAQESARAQDLAGRFAGDPTKVVNMLRVAGGEQVMIRVRVAEMQRNIAKQFGVDLTQAATVGGVPLVAATSNPYSLLGRALSDLSGAQAGFACSPALTLPTNTPTSCPGSPNNLQGTVKALERVGLVHILAEPTLTAVSGETAKFLAGGEFPVPVSRDRDGNVTIEFKQFGVGLSFTPVVLSPGRISLQVSTEVSELTNTGAFTLNTTSTTDPTTGAITTTPGITIPALSVRRAQTTVEVPSGGSFAIAGLMQHTSRQDLNAFPGLKDMPILGALFRSRDYQNNETELVIIVSAYLVDPTAATALAAPTDGYVSPTDPETILLGRLNAVYNKPTPDGAKPSPSSSVGFIVQ
ncbi:MAG TPA: type II and III secretion system protein family protein [Rhizomicrobium sp.]|jgi:pilus assembly protein CpaC|nr:type II and III secretion system protein family protein [Rhizomicrobium sp.]